jgi:hypothetical protein
VAAGDVLQPIADAHRVEPETARGHFRSTFHFRSATEWTTLFADSGWTVESWPMGHGTPFANVLFKLTKPA